MPIDSRSEDLRLTFRASGIWKRYALDRIRKGFRFELAGAKWQRTFVILFTSITSAHFLF